MPIWKKEKRRRKNYEIVLEKSMGSSACTGHASGADAGGSDVTGGRESQIEQEKSHRSGGWQGPPEIEGCQGKGGLEIQT